MVSPQARREQVALARERGLSERRAYGYIGPARSGLSYELRLPAKHAPVIAAMRARPAQYRSYSCRRIHIFLGRQGFELRWSRRIASSARLACWCPGSGRAVAWPTRAIGACTPFKANAVWAYEFVFDPPPRGSRASARPCSMNTRASVWRST